MKFIGLSRRCGKTIRLLYASEFNEIPILCATHEQKHRLMEQAKKIGLNIPEPLSVYDLTHLTRADFIDKDILVDEAPSLKEILKKT